MAPSVNILPGDDEAQKAFKARINEVCLFVTKETNQFIERWNSPMKEAEALQWSHEIEAECVLSVDKRTGMISVESVSDAPDSEELAKFRSYICQENGLAANAVKPFASDPAELDRFGGFVLSLAPMTLPESLLGLPGDSVRLRISLLVVGFDEQANSYVPSPGGKKSPLAKGAGSNAAVRTATAKRSQDSGQVARARLPQNTDEEDPVFQYTLGFQYLEGQARKMDFGLAFYHFEKAAGRGYAPAQTQLAFMYQAGQGAARDPAKALFWYRKAADQGDSRAMYNVSCMYQNGDGVERDLAEAARWNRKGADLGDPLSQFTLGTRYAVGDGVAREPVEGFNWYLKAAEQDYAMGQCFVGKMYEEGQGVVKNEAEALAWYDLAVAAGYTDATKQRDRLEQRLGPQASAEARRRADDLHKRIQQKKVTP